LRPFAAALVGERKHRLTGATALKCWPSHIGKVAGPLHSLWPSANPALRSVEIPYRPGCMSEREIALAFAKPLIRRDIRDDVGSWHET
jgi:hypothetical protein